MLAKLAELMFVEAIRSHLDRLPADARGWLAGVRDPQVGAALRFLHGRPAHSWTAERLAREVGMSRSSFAERFTSYVGIPPMHYLGRWRLQLAARLLEAESVSVSQAAAAVGYSPKRRSTGPSSARWGRRPAPGAAAANGDPTEDRSALATSPIGPKTLRTNYGTQRPTQRTSTVNHGHQR